SCPRRISKIQSRASGAAKKGREREKAVSSNDSSGKVVDGSPADCHFPAARIAGLPEKPVVHQFNANAIRHTRSVGDMAGLTDMGLHIVRGEPGRDTTEHHFHGQDEEFLYVISGHAEATIGEESFTVRAGD